MKLQALAVKPKLTKLLIDDEATVEKYGEAIEFYIYDRYSMEFYMELSSLDTEKEVDKMRAIAYDVMLDEEGNRIMQDGVELPMDIQIKAVEKTFVALGNAVTQTSLA